MEKKDSILKKNKKVSLQYHKTISSEDYSLTGFLDAHNENNLFEFKLSNTNNDYKESWIIQTCLYSILFKIPKVILINFYSGKSFIIEFDVNKKLLFNKILDKYRFKNQKKRARFFKKLIIF